MAGMISFNRNYAAFAAGVRPFESADDVGLVVTEFLWDGGFPFYPIGALIDAKISSAWLGESDAPGNEADLDLIFKMRELEGANYFEIILRTASGPIYGGWVAGQSLEVTDEFINGHRVLIGHDSGAKGRYEFDLQASRYLLIEVFGGASARGTVSIRAMRKSRRHR